MTDQTQAHAELFNAMATGAAAAFKDRFFSAAAKGDLPALQACLDVLKDPAMAPMLPGIFLNMRTEQGSTALMKAADNNRPEAVKMLLGEPGIDVNAQNSEGQTALIRAVIGNNIECVRALLSAPGIDVNIQDTYKNNTALMYALMSDDADADADALKLLLAAPGMDVNAKGRFGKTPLMVAAEWGYTEVVQILLTAEGIGLNDKDAAGMTALMHAASLWRLLVVEALLAMPRIDAEAISENKKTAIDYAGKHGPIRDLIAAHIAAKKVNAQHAPADDAAPAP